MGDQKPQVQQQIRDQLNLECSLFTLTKRCFKICTMEKLSQNKKPAIYNQYKEEELIGILEYFDQCMETCVFNYATMRNNVKSEILTHMTEIEEKNDQIYNSWYKSDE